MAGRRQHTVPRFLLRAFASSTRKRVTKAWCFTKDREPVEANIDNIGHQRDFYGRPGPGTLDDKITHLEDRYARVLSDLRLGAGAQLVDGPLIPSMVAHFTMRTRAVRESTIGIATEMVDAVQQNILRPAFLRDVLKQAFSEREIAGIARKHLRAEGLSPMQTRRALPNIMASLLPAVDQFITEIVHSAPAEFGPALASAISSLPATMQDSFNERLLESIDGGIRAEAYAKFLWWNVEVGESLILGDSICIFEVPSLRHFAPIDDDATRTRRIFMPISDRRVLVGVRDGDSPMIDPPVLKSAVASCSFEYFVSAFRDAGEAVRHLIGFNAGVLSPDERTGIIESQDYEVIAAQVVEEHRHKRQ